jgi:cysteine desulfurase
VSPNSGHEAGRWRGTENVLEIVGLGAACELAQRWIEDANALALRDVFLSMLETRFGDCVVLNRHPERRLPNTLNVGFCGEIGSENLAGRPSVIACTDSACHAGSIHISPVLAGMGVP